MRHIFMRRYSFNTEFFTQTIFQEANSLISLRNYLVSSITILKLIFTSFLCPHTLKTIRVDIRHQDERDITNCDICILKYPHHLLILMNHLYDCLSVLSRPYNSEK